MSVQHDHLFPININDESSCISYLFAKRWPWGFRCPMCGMVQKEAASAFTVVCRFCRRKTSITAHTVMHGSKKSLVAWVLVARQFCERRKGISARELQRLFELSCYQTAWSWLQKIRCGAALAESAPCRGVVIFDLIESDITLSTKVKTPSFGLALELNKNMAATNRLRMAVVGSHDPAKIDATIRHLVLENSTLLVNAELWAQQLSFLGSLPDHYLIGHPNMEHLRLEQLLLGDLIAWLNKLYRSTIDGRYLQNYLDEYSFRHNTASWQDGRMVLDHLLTGLVSPINEQSQHHPGGQPREV